MTNDNTLARLHYLALSGYFGLLLFMPLWHFVLVPEQPLSDILFVLLFVMPLLLPLRGLLQANPYTHAWANFIVLWYLGHGLMVLWLYPEERLYAIIELLLASTQFIGGTFYARPKGKALGIGLKGKQASN